MRLILAEFAPVPNAPSDVVDASASDAKSAAAVAVAADVTLSGAPAIPRASLSARSHEIGGPPGPEPTRFGDWEKNGRCLDF
jgi:hypothetical protein